MKTASKGIYPAISLMTSFTTLTVKSPPHQSSRRKSSFLRDTLSKRVRLNCENIHWNIQSKDKHTRLSITPKKIRSHLHQRENTLLFSNIENFENPKLSYTIISVARLDYMCALIAYNLKCSRRPNDTRVPSPHSVINLGNLCESTKPSGFEPRFIIERRSSIIIIHPQYVN